MARSHPLPALVLLVAVDPGKQRVAGGNDKLSKLISAAALEELTLRGLLHDDGGKVRPETTGFAGDAVLDGVLARIRESQKARNWKHWVNKDAKATRIAVRDALEAAGVIAVERHRVLGLFPAERIAVRDHRAGKDLRGRAARALTGSTPVSQLDPADRTLAVLAALGELNTVTTGAKRREHRARIKQLIEASGPAMPAVKKVLADDVAATSGAV